MWAPCCMRPASPASPDAKVSRCSGGEQQRIKFALATLPDPDLLILDEPTAGMDVDARRAFWATMRTDAAAGRTVLFATHYLEEADTFADRIVLIAGPDRRRRTHRRHSHHGGRRVVSAIVDDDEIARLTGRLPGVEIIEYRVAELYLAAPDSDAGSVPAHHHRRTGRWRSRATTSKTRSSPSPQAPPGPDRDLKPTEPQREGFPHDHHAPLGMSATFLRTDLRRVLRNRRALIFAVIMPAVLYLVFGAPEVLRHSRIRKRRVLCADRYGHVRGDHRGRVERGVGGAGTGVGLDAHPDDDRLRPTGYVATKVIVALSMGALPMLVLAVAGLTTGADAPAGVWIACLALGWLGSAVFAAFGLTVGALFRSDGAMQVMGGGIALLAFAGNVFVPLQGTMLTISQFTPMFGVVSIARYPLDHGMTAYDEHIS